MVMPAPALVTLAWISLGGGVASGIVIAADVFVRGYRLKMPIMEAVWPITGLYFGPVALWGYYRFGRTTSTKWLVENHRQQPPEKPRWARMAVGVSHCGAGCTLGDIAAGFAVFALALTVAGTALPFEYFGDYLAAIILGMLFQYFAIAPHARSGRARGHRSRCES